MGRMGRTDFTESDDVHLVEYIAKYKPEPAGRLGNNLYKTLEENPGNRWPWSKSHSWQSWRERYKKNQQYFDYHIRHYQKGNDKASKDVVTKKSAKQAENTPTSTKGAASSVKENKRRAEAPSNEAIVKVERTAAQRGEEKEKEKTGSSIVVASDQTSALESTGRIVQGGQNDQEETGDRPAIPDDYMHELFGSSEEEDEVEEIQEPRKELQSKAPAQNIYPNLDDAPAPTLGPEEPHVPGAFEVAVQQLSQEPTPPKSGAENSNIETSLPLLIHRPQAKKPKKRKVDEDPFESPPTTPPLPSRTTVAKRKPTTLVEGPFRNSLKRPRTTEDAVEDAWPPKRMRAAAETTATRDAQQSIKPSVPEPGLPLSKALLQPRPQVNAVASSSKVKLPDVRTSYSVQGKNDSTHSSSLPEMKPLTNPTGNNAPAPSKIAQNAKASRKIKGSPTTQHPDTGQASEKALPTASLKPNETRVFTPEGEALSPPVVVSNFLVHVSRTGSNDALPTRPSSDGDPFTSKEISGKAAGKAPGEPYVLDNKPSRRIDLHRQSLTKRPRASTSFPSRPSSALSMRTSTSSGSKKVKNPRRSNSLRRSIAELNWPEEDKEFAVAAAEDVVQLINAMAKQHGVSTEVALKTYMNTRSMEKTKIVLDHLSQGLLALEQEIYSRMPSLRYTSDEEADPETPAGLIPQRHSGKKDEAYSSHRKKHDSSSPRRSRPSLVVKPFSLDEVSDREYSPPNFSRAGQFARLDKQGRRQEALEREQRRASGAFVPQSQSPAKRHITLPLGDISPTPQAREVAMQVDHDEDEDDIHMHSDEEQHEADDEAEQPEERDESAFIYHSRTLSRRISEGEEQAPALARKHRTLALDVDQENAATMRQFEAANDPDFLRFMTIKWVTEILESRLQDHKMEEDPEVEEVSKVAK